MELNSKLTNEQLGQQKLLNGDKVNWPVSDGTKGLVANAQVGKVRETGFPTVLHEMGHYLGLGERYSIIGDVASMSDKGFSGDIMGVNYTTKISPIHYQNLGGTVISTGNTNGVYSGFIKENDREK